MTSGPIKITIPEIFVKIVSFNSASSALGMEYDLKVMNLLRSTKRGRLPILTTKIGTVFKITFLMAVLIHLPFILKIVKSYPMDNWGAKVRSMPFAGESVLNCTIGEYVFLLALSQILSLFVIHWLLPNIFSYPVSYTSSCSLTPRMELLPTTY